MLSAKIEDQEMLNKLIRKEVSRLKPYLSGKSIKEVCKEYRLERVIKLASNENPLGVSSRVKDVIRQECQNINRYPDQLSRSLKTDLAEKLNISDDMIIFGNGSDGLLKVIAESFLSNNSQVIIPYPTFVEYTFVANLMGSNLIRISLDDYHQNLPGIAETVNSKTSLVFLTNPHNPCGTIFSAGELEYLLDQIPEHVIIVIDQAYCEYVQDPSYPDVLKYIREGYPIIALRTFSKAYGLAGLRLGYAIAQPKIIEIMLKVRDPFNVNHLAEMAGKVALQDQRFLERTIEINQRGKAYIYRELRRLGISYVPTEANFVLVNVGVDSIALFNRLMAMGVIVRPGKPLGYPNHIRVSIGLPEENKYFLDCIDKSRA